MNFESPVQRAYKKWYGKWTFISRLYNNDTFYPQTRDTLYLICVLVLPHVIAGIQNNLG